MESEKLSDIVIVVSRSLDIMSCGLCPVSDDDMDNTWDNTGAQCQCQHFTNDMLSPCWPHQVAIITIYWLLLTLSSMISSSSTLSLKCVKDSGLKMPPVMTGGIILALTGLRTE